LNGQHVNGVDNTRTDATTTKSASSSDATEDRKDAQSLVSEASAVVAQMKSDPNLTKLLHKAKGIYIVPDFGRAALIAGAKGGAGLVLAKTATGWSNPAFYDFGSISLGAQVGASGGSVAFLLMSQDAVDAFKSGNKFSLDSDAGLSIVNYSAAAEGSWGKGDIVFWSDTEGAYAGATVGITDLNWDDGNNQAYYGTKVDPSQIISGKLAADKAEALKAALSS
jgi:lipid-binding SYLF domain-containing protein